MMSRTDLEPYRSEEGRRRKPQDWTGTLPNPTPYWGVVTDVGTGNGGEERPFLGDRPWVDMVPSGTPLTVGGLVTRSVGAPDGDALGHGPRPRVVRPSGLTLRPLVRSPPPIVVLGSRSYSDQVLHGWCSVVKMVQNRSLGRVRHTRDVQR